MAILQELIMQVSVFSFSTTNCPYLLVFNNINAMDTNFSLLLHMYFLTSVPTIWSYSLDSCLWDMTLVYTANLLQASLLGLQLVWTNCIFKPSCTFHNRLLQIFLFQKLESTSAQLDDREKLLPGWVRSNSCLFFLFNLVLLACISV